MLISGYVRDRPSRLQLVHGHEQVGGIFGKSCKASDKTLDLPLDSRASRASTLGDVVFHILQAHHHTEHVIINLSPAIMILDLHQYLSPSWPRTCSLTRLQDQDSFHCIYPKRSCNYDGIPRYAERFTTAWGQSNMKLSSTMPYRNHCMLIPYHLTAVQPVCTHMQFDMQS